jgi:molybdenum cofactor guanylyltransferase
LRQAQTPLQNDAQGFVLAGGKSNRMGTDKALVDFQGQPLIVRALATLHEAGVPGFIAGSRVSLENYATVIADPGLGPLGGICAALASAWASAVVFLSVDMPLIPAGLLELMLDHARISEAAITLASVNGYPQTFPAIVQRAALPALESAFQEGNRGCFTAFQSAATRMGRPLVILPVELLAQVGQVAHQDGLHPSLWFQNLNQPADIACAESIVAAHHRVS